MYLTLTIAALHAHQDPHHFAWEGVHMARVIAADYDIDVSEAFTDREGRTIVDALPSERDAFPVTCTVRDIMRAA